MAMQTAVLLLGSLTAGERRWMHLILCLNLATLLARLHLPRKLHTARVRTPLLVALRTSVFLIPLIMNTQRAIQPAGSTGSGGSDERVPSLGGTLRSLFLLLLPLAWVDGCLVAAVAWPLPPLAHLLLQTVGVGMLMWRAPTGCAQYVAQHSSNGRVVHALYWVLRQLASLLCLGTREHLAAAATAASDTEQCTAVVWALQVSLGLVLPTLLVWRPQLLWARTQAAELALITQGYQQAGEADGSRQRAQQPLPAQHRMLCQPLLDAAGAVTWPVVIGGAALAAFVTAVLARQEA